MEPRVRSAVSTYLEVFILIGVAVGGSGLVYAATAEFRPAVQGGVVNLSQASIRQGANQAVERMVVSNTGTVSFTSITISTVGIPNAQFYVALANLATGTAVAPSLASGNTGDSSITESVTLAPGQSILASIIVVSTNEFTVGQSYTIIVGASGAAQASMQVAATPA